MSNLPGLTRGLINLLSPQSSAEHPNQYLEVWTGQTTFLEVFLRQICALRSIDHVVAFVSKDTPKLALDLLDQYSIQAIEPPGIFPFPSRQSYVVSSRKWSYQNWAGCPNGFSIYDEIVPMAMVGYFTELTQPKTLAVFTPETPFFEPTSTDHMIKKAGESFEDMDFDILCRPSPMGISPFIIAESRLKELNTYNVWRPAALLMSPYSKVPIKIRSAMNFPKLDNERRNFLLRSKRDRQRLQAWDGKFENMVELTNEPKELQIEVTSHSHHKLTRYPELLPLQDMPFEQLQNIIQQSISIEDILITIGDLGSLWHYSHKDKLREWLIHNRPYGIHLIFDAKDIFENFNQFRPWAEANFDIITIRLTSLGTTSEDLQPYESYVEKIQKEFHTPNNRTVFNFELHKYHDNWKMIETLQEWNTKHKIAFNWVGYNDFAGQLDHKVELPVYSPREKKSCQKLLNQMHILPDGRVTACRQDFLGKNLIGDLSKQSLMEVWNGEKATEYRQKTQKDYHCTTELCKNCQHGFFV